MQRLATVLWPAVLLGAAALLIWWRIGSLGAGERSEIMRPTPLATSPADPPRLSAPEPRTASAPVSASPTATTSPAQAVLPERTRVDFSSPLAANVRVPLSELLAAAQASDNRQRGGVLTIARLACGVSRHMPANTDKDLLSRALRFFQGLDDAAIRVRTAEVEAARATLDAWCRDYDEKALSAAFREIHRADGRPPVSVTSPLKPDSPWRDVQRQYIEQVLLNPQIKSAEFDLWLAHGMAKQVPMVAALSWEQRYLVRDLLYQSLTGATPDPLSIRSLQACMVLKWCPSSLEQMPPEQREQARRVAEQIEALLRSQRLDELLHWPG